MKTYEPSDQDLIRWIGTFETEAEVNQAGYWFGVDRPEWRPEVGEVVVVRGHGKFRRGVVLSVGRLRAKVQFTTPSAASYAPDDWPLNRTTPSVPFGLIAGVRGPAELVDGTFSSARLVEVPVNDAGFVDQPDLSDEQRTRLDTELVEDLERDDWQDRHPHAAIVYGNRPTTKIPEPGWYSQCRAPGCPGHWRTGLPTEQVAREVYEQHVFYSSQCCPDSQPTSKGPVWEEVQEFYGGPAAATGSAVVTALERMCQAVRANHPELPEVVVVTGSGFMGSPRWGHTRHGGWTDRQNQVTQDGVTTNARLVEVFVAGECLARGAEFTLETILHELAHVLAGARGVQDTSRQGRWHNQQFRKLAEELGLEYPKDQAHSQVGFSECVLTPGTTEEYADQIAELNRVVRLAIELPGFLSELVGEDHQQLVGGEFVHHGWRGKTAGGRTDTNNVKAVCDCSPPRIIRASRKVIEQGFIACGLCHQAFEPEGSKFEPTDEG